MMRIAQRRELVPRIATHECSSETRRSLCAEESVRLEVTPRRVAVTVYTILETHGSRPGSRPGYGPTPTTRRCRLARLRRTRSAFGSASRASSTTSAFPLIATLRSAPSRAVVGRCLLQTEARSCFPGCDLDVNAFFPAAFRDEVASRTRLTSEHQSASPRRSSGPRTPSAHGTAIRRCLLTR
jgi:hypothetical protein